MRGGAQFFRKFRFENWKEVFIRQFRNAAVDPDVGEADVAVKQFRLRWIRLMWHACADGERAAFRQNNGVDAQLDVGVVKINRLVGLDATVRKTANGAPVRRQLVVFAVFIDDGVRLVGGFDLQRLDLQGVARRAFLRRDADWFRAAHPATGVRTVVGQCRMAFIGNDKGRRLLNADDAFFSVICDFHIEIADELQLRGLRQNR